MKQTPELELGRQIAITPRMQRAIRLLQLPTFELRGEPRQLLESSRILGLDDDLSGGEEEWRGGTVRGTPPSNERRRAGAAHLDVSA